MTNPIFDKTDKGRDEIATRKHHLAPRLRTMLLLIDGKSTVEQVLQKVAGLGLDMAGITGLLEQAMIVEIASAAQSPAPSVDPVAAAPLGSAAVTLPEPVSEAPAVPVTAAAPVAPTSGTATSAQPAPVVDTQFQSVYNFFNETIKKTIGLRGFALQLKVERASTLDDFRALRDSYIAAVKNAHGPEVARDLGDRLDALLAARP
jgi:hypothetical protein